MTEPPPPTPTGPAEPADSRDRSVSLKSRTVSGSVWTLVSVVAGAPVALAGTVLSGRLLGVEGFGRVALLIYVTGLAISLSDLGITTVLQRRVALAFGEDDRRGELVAAQEALLITAFRMLAFAATSAVLIRDPAALALVAVSAVVQVLPSSAAVYLTGTSRSAVMAKVGIASNAAGYVGLIIVAARTRNPDLSFAAFSVLTNAPRLVYLWCSEHSVMRFLRPRLVRPTRPEWRFAIFGFIDGQLATLLFSRSELLFFPSSMSRERGAFAAATTVGARLTIAIDSLFGPVPLALAAVRQRGQDVYVQSLTAVFRIAAALFALSFPALLVISVFVLPYFFPPEFGSLGVAVLVLSCVSLLQTAGQPIIAALIAEGRAGAMLAASVVGATIDLVGSAVLVPRFGFEGAVVCNTGAGLVYIVWLFAIFRGQLPRRQYRRFLAVATAAVALGALLGCLLLTSPLARPLSGVVLTAVGVLTGGILVRRTGLLGPSEFRLLAHSSLGRRLRRPLRLIGTTQAPG